MYGRVDFGFEKRRWLIKEARKDYQVSWFGFCDDDKMCTLTYILIVESLGSPQRPYTAQRKAPDVQGGLIK